jgi:hypothetical protein
VSCFHENLCSKIQNGTGLFVDDYFMYLQIAMRYIIFISFLAIGSVLQASESNRPIGINCAFSEPPPGAGEGWVHGMTILIYPRAKDIVSGYTGCQTVFAEINGKWGIVLMIEVLNGDPIRIWSEDGAGECIFQNGKIIHGNPGDCPSPDDLLIKSMPSGCVKAKREAAKDHAQKVSGCEYE